MPTLVTGGGGSADIQGTGAKASGSNAHIEGLNTKASGNNSHAEGTGGASTAASGLNAHTEGNNCNASGGNSHAEGNSTVASGQTSHSEGTSCVASGAESHAEGTSCYATALTSHAEGYSTQAAGDYSHAEGESTNTAAGATGSHSEGSFCDANATQSHAQGHSSKAFRLAQDAQASGQIAQKGDAQTSVMVLFTSTTNATPKTLTAGGGTASYSGTGTNVYTVAVNVAATFELLVTARRQTTDEVAGWRFSGVITRVSAGNARIVGTVVTNTWADAGASTWVVTVTADTTNQALKVEVTGVAAQNISWVARLQTAELVR